MRRPLIAEDMPLTPTLSPLSGEREPEHPAFYVPRSGGARKKLLLASAILAGHEIRLFCRPLGRRRLENRCFATRYGSGDHFNVVLPAAILAGTKTRLFCPPPPRRTPKKAWVGVRRGGGGRRGSFFSLASSEEERAGVRRPKFFIHPLTPTLSPFGRGEGVKNPFVRASLARRRAGKICFLFGKKGNEVFFNRRKIVCEAKIKPRANYVTHGFRPQDGQWSVHG